MVTRGEFCDANLFIGIFNPININILNTWIESNSKLIVIILNI